MSMRAVNQNNVLAGTFVIAGIFLAVAMSFILGDLAGKFGSKNEYVVRFPTSVGVVGLEAGADVTFAGLSVGRVTSVGVHYVEDEATGTQVPGAMDVVIEVESDLVIYEDAIADLSPPILGGISRINIASAGTGSVSSDDERYAWASDPNSTLDSGEILMGRFAPSILTQMGLGAEEAEKIKALIERFPEWSDRVSSTTEHAEETMATVRRMTEKLEPNFNSGVDDGRTTIENIRIFSERLSAEGGWRDRIDSIMESADNGVAKFETTLDDANETMASARELIDDNSGKIGRILDNVEHSTERVRLETIDRMNDLLAQGSLTIGSAQDTIDEINGVVVENRPRVGTTLVNVRQLSLDAKLMVEELRSQPWRILSKPSKSDLRREPLYEAARSYARAVSDLRSASESLDTAVRLAGGAGSDPSKSAEELTTELKRLAAVVEQAYGRYEQAERGLLGLLAESP